MEVEGEINTGQRSLQGESRCWFSYFIYLFIEGVCPSQPHRVTSGLFTRSNPAQVVIQYKTCTVYKRKTYKHNPKVSPFGIALVNKMANKVRRCWYHYRFGWRFSILTKILISQSIQKTPPKTRATQKSLPVEKWGFREKEVRRLGQKQKRIRQNEQQD